ncbi:chemotaxis protein CheB [Neokomagataea thailandica]|uniref:histidine kinase n=1 Tax=Neokomagataea tanensis NBRC 106556 TaxID=1223519 RepID=A0ABQ0QL08_9PROT|nr:MULTISPECIES: chemotaxis protein CheB [Neokomagataea]GBR48470.1 chemotaxis protein CheR [Neokomagataea tanensis NBRC 106556]
MNNTAKTLPFIVGVGSSAGGIEALRSMFSATQAPIDMAFVIVQHLDPDYNSLLAQLLDRYTNLTVLQCEGGETLLPEHVYIIPPGHGLLIAQGRLELTDFVQPRGVRRPIDDFFRSLAIDQRNNAACVVLSGTGADGTIGAQTIKEYGGLCIAQTPDTARYDSMPLSAISTGHMDFIYPPSDIIPGLQKYLKQLKTTSLPANITFIHEKMDEICHELRNVVGHDFSGYKHSTLLRRIARRMHIVGIESEQKYLELIKNSPEESQALFKDFLINVTKFFRDPDAFKQLHEKVIKPLVHQALPNDELRIWVPACSSGEEAYSIAILFAETIRLSGLNHRISVQIFASDIDENIINIGREGTYPLASLIDIPEHLKKRYTTPIGDKFKITPFIRNMVRFSNHNLLRDPPFSKIDLISCRNVLIYFNDTLQKAVAPILHFAAKPGRFLFLGPSDSMGRFEGYFSTIDLQARIFMRSPESKNYPLSLPNTDNFPIRIEKNINKSAHIMNNNENNIYHRVLDKYSLPTAVINKENEIISAFGKIGRYFHFPVSNVDGTNIFTLSGPDLRAVLGKIIRETRFKKRKIIARKITIHTEFVIHTVDIVCDPLDSETLLIVFIEAAATTPRLDDDFDEFENNHDHIEQLENELRHARHSLRMATEELETANEELKSSNEEMMSMNEELQSTNEELSTVNDELKIKIGQLSISNNDLRNFLDSTNLSVIVIDKKTCIRNFTKSVTHLFPLKNTDKGRPLADVYSPFDINSYYLDAINVAQGGSIVQKRITTRDQLRVYALRILPYHSDIATISGATLVFTDITDALSLERQLSAERDRLNLAIKAAHIGIWSYCPSLSQTTIDIGNGTSISPQATSAHSGALVFPADQDLLKEKLDLALKGIEKFDCSFRTIVPNGETRWIRGYGHLITQQTPVTLIGVSIDVTPEHILVETRELMVQEMNHRIKNLFAIIGSMITIAAQRHDNVPLFAKSMRERIVALGTAHAATPTTHNHDKPRLEQLISAILMPYKDLAHVSISGPHILIHQDALSSLALIFHEWSTNAVKYGALDSDAKGVLTVTWCIQNDTLHMEWTEEKKRQRSFETQKGFGRILEDISIRQLNATSETTIDNLLFRKTLTLPKRCYTHE